MMGWSEDIFLSVAEDFELEFLKFIVQDFEYNDDHERYMIEQIENKIYQAQENQALKLLSGMN